MSDEYYEGDDAPAPQAPSPLRKRAGAVVAGAAIAAVERAESMKDRLDRRVDKMNKWASQNIVGRYFMFKERRAKLSTEMRAGVITFLMVAYVLAVNPQILGVTGGTCDPATLCDPDVYKLRGNACLFDTDNTAATDCLSTLRMSLTTATAASSLISCFIMGFFANLPLALAPGMGINIYVAYQVVSQGLLTYEQALTAIFLEGWIFIALSMTGIRGGLIRMMPKNIAFASSVGIGLLLAFSGLRNLGVIVFDSNTLLTVGGCPPKNRRYAFTPDIAAVDPANLTDALNASLSSAASIAESSAAVYSCVGGEMRSATMWLGFAGGLIMSYLLIAGIPGSLFIGIAFVTVISWIPGHSASYLGEGSSIPGGAARMEVFEQVVAAPSLEGIGLAWDWSACGSGHFWVALLTFLYIDLLDCTGTLLSMATLMDDCMRRDADDEGKLEVYEPFLSDTKEFAGQQWAFLSDGIGIVTGAMMGITPVTVYIESAAGIEDGGRTGVAAISVAFFFFIALFFSPILASIPPYATGPALILVGVLLIAHVDRIEWDNELESIPAFATLIVMPYTLSVAYGVIAGLVCYFLLHAPGWISTWTKSRYAAWRKRRRIAKGLEEEEDGEEGGGGGYTPSVSSTRSRRRIIHRKTFGGNIGRVSSMTTDGLGPGGSFPAELAHLEVVEPGVMYWGTGRQPGATGRPIVGGGLQRSTSHGSFPVAICSSAAAGGALFGGGSRMGPRGSSPYNGPMGGGESNYSSRNGSWGPEAVLGSTIGGGSVAGGSPRGGSPTRRGLTRTMSYGVAQQMGREPPAATRVMSRSHTFTDGSRGGGGSSGALGSSLRRGGLSAAMMPMAGVAPVEETRMDAQERAELTLGGGGGGGGEDSGLLFGGKLLSLDLDSDEEEAVQAAVEAADREAAAAGEAGPSGGGPSGGDSGLLFGGKLLSLDLDSDEEEKVQAAVEAADREAAAAAWGSDDAAAGGGLLFGGQLLNLDLESTDDEDQQQQQQQQQSAAATTPGPAPEPPELESRNESLVLNGSESDTMDPRVSVDLASFRLGRPSSSVSTASLPAAPSGASGLAPADSLGGVGSMSFDNAAARAAAEAAAAADAAGATGPSETVRIEGWPASVPGSPQQPQQPPVEGSPARGMKRVESAAALRLRNLFSVENEGEGGEGSGAEDPASRRAFSRISSSPPSFPGSRTNLAGDDES